MKGFLFGFASTTIFCCCLGLPFPQSPAPSAQPSTAPAKQVPQLSPDLVIDYLKADAEVAKANAHQQLVVFRMIQACGEEFGLGQDQKGNPACVAKPAPVPAKTEGKK